MSLRPQRRAVGFVYEQIDRVIPYEFLRCAWNAAGWRAPRPSMKVPAAEVGWGLGSGVRRRQAAFFQQAVEPGAEVAGVFADQVNDLALALHLAAHAEQRSAEERGALALKEPGPDHEIGDAGLVLEGQEDHAIGGA